MGSHINTLDHKEPRPRWQRRSAPPATQVRDKQALGLTHTRMPFLRFLFSISVTPTHFPPRHATHPPTPPHPTSILTGDRHPLWVAGTWARLLVTHLQAPFSFSLLCLLLRRCKPKHHHVSRQRWHQRKHTGKVSTASPYKPPSHPPAPPSHTPPTDPHAPHADTPPSPAHAPPSPITH